MPVRKAERSKTGRTTFAGSAERLAADRRKRGGNQLLLYRKTVFGRKRRHDTADFRQSSHAANRGVAGMRRLSDVVQQFMAMVGAERNVPVCFARIAPAFLFTQQHFDDADHIVVAAEV